MHSMRICIFMLSILVDFLNMSINKTTKYRVILIILAEEMWYIEPIPGDQRRDVVHWRRRWSTDSDLYAQNGQVACSRLMIFPVARKFLVQNIEARIVFLHVIIAIVFVLYFWIPMKFYFLFFKILFQLSNP